jgi:hypothetical protein
MIWPKETHSNWIKVPNTNRLLHYRFPVSYCLHEYLPARFEPLTQPRQLLRHCCTPECLSYHTHSYTLGPGRSDAWLRWMARLSLAAWGDSPPSVAACVSRNDKEMTSVSSAGDNIWSGKESAVACRDLSGQYVLCKSDWLDNLLINPLTPELSTICRDVAFGEPSSKSVSYLKGPASKFLPKYRLSWMTCLMVFHIASKQMTSKYLN